MSVPSGVPAATTATATPAPPPASVSQLSRQRVRAAWLFLLPTLVVLGMVAGWPLLRTFWFAFTNANLSNPEPPQFVGLENFATVWDDPDWWQSVRNTFFFTGISVTLETVLGMMIALTLNTRFRGRGVLRAAVLVPWAIPTVVSARMWGWMFHDVYGVINAMFLHLGFIDAPIAWTADPRLSMAAVIAVDVWKTTPFMTLLLLAALQMLPDELYEAAKLDGAGPIRVFFKVTLPLIRGPMLVAIIFRVLDAMRVFDLFYVLTTNSSESMSMAVYARQQMFEFQELGLGAAAASMLFAVIAMFTAVYLVLGRSAVEEAA
ncbi:sugar ABC transporter permease [Archangium violaceum]|uniref:carbohydrate ABC transporter permease n=1 Tax=Archangium violaceum TaxID=83451 RepID=UPI001951EAD1|nr:sugar ABC transporter permease [Archangium violaceum]QRO00873.1 sugar ABC transporter permease [Archangium violaceum]